MPDAVMLFAAGFGTRMKALTQDRPKPLVHVAGRPLIDHAMQIVRDYGPRTVVANAHYRAEQIVDHFAGSEVRVQVEAPDILDTGGGLKAALPLLHADPVFTMNTDAVWKGPNPLTLLSEAWTDDMQALLLCIPKDRAIGHVGQGDIDIGADGSATWGNTNIYSGVQILRTKCVSDTPQTVFSLKSVWDRLERNGQLRAIAYPGCWCDVGHPAGIGQAEAMLEGDDV